MLRLFAATFAYNNGAPNSKLPALGWSSWVALGPGAEHPIFDYCDESGVMAAVDAFHAVGLYEAGYRHFHLDDCWATPTSLIRLRHSHRTAGAGPVGIVHPIKTRVRVRA